MKHTFSKHEQRLEQTKMLLMSHSLEGLRSFVKVPLSELALICNGCGAADSKWDYIPDRIIGSYIGHACFLHDWEYYLGTTKKEKEEADQRFKRNLLKIIKIKSTSIVIIALKYSIACLYYFGVKKFGKKAFWRNKTR